MNRRNLIKSAITSACVLSVGGMTVWLHSGPGAYSLNWQATLSLLAELKTKKLASLGIWRPNQVFTHLAQSVEFSMTGYPDHKSAAFKNIIGKSVFSAFIYKGAMNHGLSEPIPDAPKLVSLKNHDDSLDRLKASLLNFDVFNGTLKPHFAYGVLTKEEYRLAHMMHINNHLTEIQVV